MFTAYTAATPCTNNNAKTTGNRAYPLTPGVYFISGTLTLTGGSSITGTGVTLVLLPGASIDTKGGGTLTLTGPTTAPSTSSLPASLQADASLFQDMALYAAPTTPPTAMQFGGTSNINLAGNMYAPTASVTLQGNPTIRLRQRNEPWPTHRRFDRVPWECHRRRHRVPSGNEAEQPVCVFGAMMRKLDQRGTAALEFCLVVVPLFTLMFVIFDLGRYAITVQSLRMLANAEARAMMIACYTPAVVGNTSPSSCTGDYLSNAQKQAAAPFLYGAGLTPTVTIALTSGTTPLRCYDVATRFHHGDADMGHSIQRAERLHLGSLRVYRI